MTTIDKGCWERGCACYDEREGEEGVQVFEVVSKQLKPPEPPPECQTEAEKKAFAFGWWKAMEKNT
jgi:hypothetical protein